MAVTFIDVPLRLLAQAGNPVIQADVLPLDDDTEIYVWLEQASGAATATAHWSLFDTESLRLQRPPAALDIPAAASPLGSPHLM